MTITDFNIKIEKDVVMMLIDCYPSSPIYDEVVEELEDMLPEACVKLSPVALLEFGSITDYNLDEYGQYLEEALFCIESVGGEISLWATEFFQNGNYLRGMLANAIADACLFQMDDLLKDSVIKLCKERKLGVSRRLEAPQDIPMEAQKTAWEVTQAEKKLGIRIKESYMYEPVKTTCQIYLLNSETGGFRVEHDCSKCPQIDCKMRTLQKFQVTVKSGGTEQTVEGMERQTLAEILQNAGIYLNAVCGGKGTCGKCKVQFLKGHIPVTKEDEIFFSRQELKEGYRLACKAIPNQCCEILVGDTEEEGFVVLADYGNEHSKNQDRADEKYGIAADIGTTTIAMQLVNLKNKTVVDTYTAINRQRAFGADVISRIEASNSGKAKQLQQSILGDLKKGIHTLLEDKDIITERMVISGNTTMIHLLMGYSCQTLGVYPFTPVNIHTIYTNYRKMFGTDDYQFDITIFPGISTYVGGDITAGLYACGFGENEKVSVLIDLGTNGEMAIGCKDRIIVASTAAGPAFEGGNIVHGTGSVPGAVCSAVYESSAFGVQTIGQGPAMGICGTGVVDITYELLKNELIDETGLMEDEYFEKGILIARNVKKEIRFYQKDVREIQLAKAAVRAGIETLLINYGMSCEEIDSIFIAGGFGCQIDVDKAVGIGLLPEACRGKVKAVGNTALKGACRYLTMPDNIERVNQIIECAEEIPLSTSQIFNEYFVEHMYF